MEKKRGVSPPRERSEEDLRQERREYALMERRHRMALIGMEFEALLFSEEQDERVRSHALRIFIASLDSSLALVYDKIVERHQKRRGESQRLATWLKEKTKAEHPTALEMGTALFTEVAPQEEQQGVIKVTLEQGYVYVLAESIEDFINMTKIKNAIGIFDFTKVPEKGRGRLSAPVTFVFGSYEISAEQIAAHEKQHYINHCLLGTTDPERSSPFTRVSHITPARKGDLMSRQTELREAIFRGVKDEALCFTKEGDTAAAFMDALQTDYKQRLLSRLPKEHQMEAEESIKEVIGLLETIPLWDMEAKGRALLVQLLYPIQFERLSEWVPVIKRYYEKRIHDIREQMSHIKRQLLEVMEESYYATGNEGLKEQEKARMQEARSVFQQFHQKILGVPYKEPHVWRASEMLFLEKSFTLAFLCSQDFEGSEAAYQACFTRLVSLNEKKHDVRTLSRRAQFTVPSGDREEDSARTMPLWLAAIEQDALTGSAVRTLCQTFTKKKPVALLPVQDISGTRGMRHLKRVLEKATRATYGERTTVNYHLIRISESKIELDLSFDFFQEGIKKTTSKNTVTLYAKDVL